MVSLGQCRWLRPGLHLSLEALPLAGIAEIDVLHPGVLLEVPAELLGKQLQFCADVIGVSLNLRGPGLGVLQLGLDPFLFLAQQPELSGGVRLLGFDGGRFGLCRGFDGGRFGLCGGFDGGRFGLCGRFDGGRFGLCRLGLTAAGSASTVGLTAAGSASASAVGLSLLVPVVRLPARRSRAARA